MWIIGLNVHSFGFSRVDLDYYWYAYGEPEKFGTTTIATKKLEEDPAHLGQKPTKVEHIVLHKGDVVESGTSHDACCIASGRVESGRVFTTYNGREIFFERGRLTLDPRFSLWWLGGYSGEEYKTLFEAVEQCAASKDCPEVTRAIIKDMAKHGVVDPGKVDTMTSAEIKRAMYQYTEMGVPKPQFGKYCRWLAQTAKGNILTATGEVKSEDTYDSYLLIGSWMDRDRVYVDNGESIIFFYANDITDDPRQSGHWIHTVDSWVNRMGSGLSINVPNLWKAVEQAACSTEHPEVTAVILDDMKIQGDRDTSRDRQMTGEEIVIAMRRYTDAAK